MKSVKELLELRKQIKSKKPDFIRQDFHKKKRLAKKWRRPKGLQSKIRLKFRGKPKGVSIGYRGPKIVRGMNKTGLKQVFIRSINDLEGLDAKIDGLIISSSFGAKKRIVILKKAKELGLSILNIKSPDEYIKKVEDKINLRKKNKKEEKVKVKDTEKENKKEEKVSNEQEKDIEKKEKDKVLIKKEK